MHTYIIDICALVHLYIFACFLYIQTHWYMLTYSCIHTLSQRCTHTHHHAHTYIHSLSHTSMLRWSKTFTHIYTSSFTYIHILIHTFPHIYTLLWTHTHICTHSSNSHIHTFTCPHTHTLTLTSHTHQYPSTPSSCSSLLSARLNTVGTASPLQTGKQGLSGVPLWATSPAPEPSQCFSSPASPDSAGQQKILKKI